MSAAHPITTTECMPPATSHLRLASSGSGEAKVRSQRSIDRELVNRILEGDPNAFARLHALYAPRIHAFAVSRMRDTSEAEDIVQDTFLEVHRCLGAWEGRSRLLTWMFGIAHHQICRRFRKQRPVAVSDEQLEASAPVMPVSSGEGRVDAVRALERCAEMLDADVSDAQREIFDLYYGESRSMKEIAERVGRSSQAVKISLYRTRRALAAGLDLEGARSSG